jgi:small-conductance mechanosensitive channel
MDVLGVRLIGLTWDNLHKFVLSVLLIAAAVALRWGVIWLVRHIRRARPNERLIFWTRQAMAVILTLLGGLGLLSIWFDNPARLALPFGIVTAGIAFALQKVLTAMAGYLVVLRGKMYRVGDRVVLGGVRGDVIALGFIQTTILEMGLPPSVATKEKEEVAMWVQARQYTGRVVAVTNDKVFDTPVFNYSRLFPFIWEEIRLPIRYDSDRDRAEQILLDTAHRQTLDVRHLSQADRERMEREFFVDLRECGPRVYWRLTDNWLELTVRFVVEPRRAREVMDRMTREILGELDRAGIQVASQTQEIVGMPTLRLEGPLVERIAEALAALGPARSKRADQDESDGPSRRAG